MPEVVGVRFKPGGKIYNYEVDGFEVDPGTQVVVESEMGLSLGVVVVAKHHIEESEQELKKIIRIATEEDIEKDKNNRSLEEEAKAFCIERVKSRKLPMKIVGTEATLDRRRLIFYFTADGRIDFRELVRDLAARFKTRIEMRQIGVRDEVKYMGAMGICGREVCCKAFLTSFEPISIRMAKQQELILNPGKLSGICGRLMCCLGYELEPSEKEETVSEEAQDETVVVTDEDLTEEVTTPQDSLDSGVISPPSEAEPSEEVTPTLEKEEPAGEQRVKGKKRHRFKPKLKERGKPFSRRKKFFGKKRNR
jgi:cell fate regulator YaaT (PSP1 superfamily)